MSDISSFDGLDWAGAGYFGVPQLPQHVRFPKNIAAEPWAAFLMALQSAKEGDFSLIPALLEPLDDACDPFVQAQFILVLADAAPSFTVDVIARRVGNAPERIPGELLIGFCQIIAMRGRLADISLMLQAYEAKQHLADAEIIPCYISEMLETVASELATPLALPSWDVYRRLVLRRQQDVAEVVGSEDALVYGGAQYSVEALAKRILSHAKSGTLDPDERRRFEAATGINCQAFYRRGRLQPLQAAAVVEGFLDDGRAGKYLPGMRYFFGYQIPG